MAEMRTGPIGPEELALAARNHGMPLEALRYPVTPAGLHYLLIHYDIPPVHPGAWRLEIDGNVGTPLTLSIDELAARPRATVAVTLECAGNGRALQSPRPVSQPWLLEAVGMAEWTRRTAPAGAGGCGGAGGLRRDPVHGPRPRRRRRPAEQAYERSLPLSEAVRDDILLAYEMNGQPLLPQHGFPLRLIVPGWYGMTHVKWLSKIQVLTEPFEGYQNARAYRFAVSEEDTGEPLSRIRRRSPDGATRGAGLPRADPARRARPHPRAGPRLVGARLPSSSWSSAQTAGRPGVKRSSRPRRANSPGAGGRSRGRRSPGEHELCCRATDGTGATQPMQAEWNLGGYVNNAVQRVPVVVNE